MKIGSKHVDNLYYELGVMAYNVYKETPTGNYDMKENLKYIINSFEDFDINELKNGFLSEPENHDDHETDEDDFQKFIEEFEKELELL